jgi:hypothetical protein
LTATIWLVTFDDKPFCFADLEKAKASVVLSCRNNGGEPFFIQAPNGDYTIEVGEGKYIGTIHYQALYYTVENI